MSALVLTVDANAKPFGLVPVEQAVARLAQQLAEGTSGIRALVVDESRRWRSKHLDLPSPLVVEWPGYVELATAERARVSRRVLFARDGFRCQYCGYQASPGRATRELTVDHVKPACLFPSRAAATFWENVTTACFACNQLKADRLPYECGMYPAKTPLQPSFVQLVFGGRGLHPVQRDFIRDFYALEEDELV